VAVSGSGDLVRIALAPVPATQVGRDKLAAAIRARLARLKLTPAALSTDEKGSAQVSFASREDAEAFRRDLRDGGEAFAVRVVDGEVDASGKPKAAGDLRLRSVEGETLWLRPEPLITGSMLEPGKAEFVTDELDHPRVIFRLTPKGARVLGAVTGAIVGQRLAITSDGVLLSAPVVNQQIPGGGGDIIVTDRTQGEALAARLNAASDDLPLTLVEDAGG
jgi:preprotein translocase subunit SecD